jgi:hypothetical protein
MPSKLGYADLLGRLRSELPEEEDTQKDQRYDEEYDRNNQVAPALTSLTLVELLEKQVGRDKSR